MFGRKPRTYREIVRMKACQTIQREIPGIDDELLEKIYGSITDNPNMPIYIHNGFVRFGAEGESEPIAINMDPANLKIYQFTGGLLQVIDPYTPRDNGGDSGMSGNNNNNNNNNNNA